MRPPRSPAPPDLLPVQDAPAMQVSQPCSCVQQQVEPALPSQRGSCLRAVRGRRDDVVQRAQAAVLCSGCGVGTISISVGHAEANCMQATVVAANAAYNSCRGSGSSCGSHLSGCRAGCSRCPGMRRPAHGCSRGNRSVGAEPGRPSSTASTAVGLCSACGPPCAVLAARRLS